jgi:cell division protein FtsN
LLAGAREAFVAPPAPPEATPAVSLDTLGWTVQLAAYASVDRALAHADRLAAETGVPTLVTPVPQNDGGPVWYRVLAGSYATRVAAADARSELWRRGAAAEGVGDLLRAPYSYRAPAGASLDSLRGHGLPAVRWPASGGGGGGILIGAFESAEQAAFTQAALARAGVRATLLPRMGTP